MNPLDSLTLPQWWLLAGLGSGCLGLVSGYCHSVQYPAFKDVTESAFVRFHQRHATGTGIWVLGPLALLPIAAAMLVVLAPGWPSATLMTMMIIGHAATFLVAAPCHGRLSQAVCPRVFSRLMIANLVRTIAWLAGAVLAFSMVWPALR